MLFLWRTVVICQQTNNKNQPILPLVQMVNHVCPSVGPLHVTLPPFPHMHTHAPPAPPTNSPKSSRYFFCTIYKNNCCIFKFTCIVSEHDVFFAHYFVGKSICQKYRSYLCWPECLSIRFFVNICLFFERGMRILR